MLTGRLAADFKTIADVRQDNGPAIRAVCREFVLPCRRLRLFERGIVAVGGSKITAVDNRDKNFTERKLEARLQQLEDSIAHCLAEPDRDDREPSVVLPGRVAHLKAKIAKERAQVRQLQAIGDEMRATEDQQISSLTDPDARSMATSGGTSNRSRTWHKARSDPNA